MPELAAQLSPSCREWSLPRCYRFGACLAIAAAPSFAYDPPLERTSWRGVLGYEGLRRRQHPERRPRRTHRLGKNPVGRRDVVRRRDGEPVRKGGRRHDGHRFRRGRSFAQAHPLGQPRLRGVEQAQDQHHRFAGHRQLPERSARGPHGRGCRRRGGRCGGRRDGADREGLGSRRGAAAAAHRRPEPPRSRSGQPRSVAPVAA